MLRLILTGSHLSETVRHSRKAKRILLGASLRLEVSFQRGETKIVHGKFSLTFRRRIGLLTGDGDEYTQNMNSVRT